MESYYRQRAREYDRFYQTPEFQNDLRELETWLTGHVRRRTVLEVAAGTGHWTKIASRTAKAVTATDYNPETLAVAKRRRLGAHVTLLAADAYDLPVFEKPFEVGMAHLWWSHVPRERRQEFLAGLVKCLRPKATILMLDQRFGRSFSIPASRRDARENRYEFRKLANGKTFEVMKNYPSAQGLLADFNSYCDDIRITQLKYFWTLTARLC